MESTSEQLTAEQLDYYEEFREDEGASTICEICGDYGGCSFLISCSVEDCPRGRHFYCFADQVIRRARPDSFLDQLDYYCSVCTSARALWDNERNLQKPGTSVKSRDEKVPSSKPETHAGVKRQSQAESGQPSKKPMSWKSLSNQQNQSKGNAQNLVQKDKSMPSTKLAGGSTEKLRVGENKGSNKGSIPRHPPEKFTAPLSASGQSQKRKDYEDYMPIGRMAPTFDNGKVVALRPIGSNLNGRGPFFKRLVVNRRDGNHNHFQKLGADMSRGRENGENHENIGREAYGVQRRPSMLHGGSFGSSIQEPEQHWKGTFEIEPNTWDMVAVSLSKKENVYAMARDLPNGGRYCCSHVPAASILDADMTMVYQHYMEEIKEDKRLDRECVTFRPRVKGANHWDSVIMNLKNSGRVVRFSVGQDDDALLLPMRVGNDAFLLLLNNSPEHMAIRRQATSEWNKLATPAKSLLKVGKSSEPKRSITWAGDVHEGAHTDSLAAKIKSEQRNEAKKPKELLLSAEDEAEMDEPSPASAMEATENLASQVAEGAAAKAAEKPAPGQNIPDGGALEASKSLFSRRKWVRPGGEAAEKVEPRLKMPDVATVCTVNMMMATEVNEGGRKLSNDSHDMQMPTGTQSSGSISFSAWGRDKGESLSSGAKSEASEDVSYGNGHLSEHSMVSAPNTEPEIYKAPRSEMADTAELPPHLSEPRVMGLTGRVVEPLSSIPEPCIRGTIGGVAGPRLSSTSPEVLGVMSAVTEPQPLRSELAARAIMGGVAEPRMPSPKPQVLGVTNGVAQPSPKPNILETADGLVESQPLRCEPVTSGIIGDIAESLPPRPVIKIKVPLLPSPKPVFSGTTGWVVVPQPLTLEPATNGVVGGVVEPRLSSPKPGTLGTTGGVAEPQPLRPEPSTRGILAEIVESRLPSPKLDILGTTGGAVELQPSRLDPATWGIVGGLVEPRLPSPKPDINMTEGGVAEQHLPSPGHGVSGLMSGVVEPQPPRLEPVVCGTASGGKEPRLPSPQPGSSGVIGGIVEPREPSPKPCVALPANGEVDARLPSPQPDARTPMAGVMPGRVDINIPSPNREVAPDGNGTPGLRDESSGLQMTGVVPDKVKPPGSAASAIGMQSEGVAPKNGTHPNAVAGASDVRKSPNKEAAANGTCALSYDPGSHADLVRGVTPEMSEQGSTPQGPSALQPSAAAITARNGNGGLGGNGDMRRDFELSSSARGRTFPGSNGLQPSLTPNANGTLSHGQGVNGDRPGGAAGQGYSPQGFGGLEPCGPGGGNVNSDSHDNRLTNGNGSGGGGGNRDFPARGGGSATGSVPSVSPTLIAHLGAMYCTVGEGPFPPGTELDGVVKDWFGLPHYMSIHPKPMMEMLLAPGIVRALLSPAKFGVLPTSGNSGQPAGPYLPTLSAVLQSRMPFLEAQTKDMEIQRLQVAKGYAMPHRQRAYVYTAGHSAEVEALRGLIEPPYMFSIRDGPEPIHPLEAEYLLLPSPLKPFPPRLGTLKDWVLHPVRVHVPVQVTGGFVAREIYKAGVVIVVPYSWIRHCPADTFNEIYTLLQRGSQHVKDSRWNIRVSEEDLEALRANEELEGFITEAEVDGFLVDSAAEEEQQQPYINEITPEPIGRESWMMPPTPVPESISEAKRALLQHPDWYRYAIVMVPPESCYPAMGRMSVEMCKLTMAAAARHPEVSVGNFDEVKKFLEIIVADSK